MNNLPQQSMSERDLSLATSRHSSALVLPQRENISRSFTVAMRQRLLTLFTPNSSKGFPKVGINAFRITKRAIKNRFHRCALTCCVRYEERRSNNSKLRSG